MSDRVIMIGTREIRVEIIRKPIKNVYIRALSPDVLTISAPQKKSEAEITAIIKKHMRRIETMLESRKTLPAFSDREVKFLGTIYPADTISGYSGPVTFDRDRFLFPDISIEKKKIALEHYYKEQVKKKASEVLASVPEDFLRTIGKAPVTFKSRKMKSRLGSCQKANRIVNLNSILARYGQEYLKAIVMHELVHLCISGHQSDFYRLLLTYEPDYHLLRKHLLDLMREDGI